MTGTLGGEDDSKERTNYQNLKEAALPWDEEGLAPVVKSGWAQTQPEMFGIKTALTA